MAEEKQGGNERLMVLVVSPAEHVLQPMWGRGRQKTPLLVLRQGFLFCNIHSEKKNILWAVLKSCSHCWAKTRSKCVVVCDGHLWGYNIGVDNRVVVVGGGHKPNLATHRRAAGAALL